ncbi:hypothetical protein [Methylorubrum extorquens]|uniref:hypothetical protein n=1 Tax=Methylorubrum extorquens TaxID=408 RepID=UPI0020A233C3|nr:hypothetical protein [Methylorubrum extorquens]MCP1535701.1 hypothetical protein [Methylorubrum extorquens]
MAPPNVEKAIEHLNLALALLQGDEEEPERNPEWFRDTGRLSDKGIDYINSLFEQGKTPYAAAKEMDISYRAASLRHTTWQKKNAEK